MDTQQTALASSADFHSVRAAPQPRLPERLVHHAVEQSASRGAVAFAAERRHAVSLVNLPSTSISMTIGGLLPGQATRRHRHNYETLIYIVEGAGTTWVEDRALSWQAGDAVYIPPWTWHHHANASASDGARYVACENAPLLQNLGGIAVREEVPEDG